MEALGIEAIVSLVLAGLTLIGTFVGQYFYVRGKLQKAAAGAITDAEQDDKTGEEKLELAVEQVYSLVPTSFKVFIHRRTVRKIVQAAFDKIEAYAKKQVDKKRINENNKDAENVNGKPVNESTSEVIVSSKEEQLLNNVNDNKDIHRCRDNPIQPKAEEAIKWYLV